MDIKQYYTDLNTALRNIELMILSVENKTTDEYDTVDYAGALNELYSLKRNIKRMLVVHKTQGFSKEEFVNSNATENSGSYVVQHIVKSYDTLISIAKLYDVEISEIMILNNITSLDLTPGLVLDIRTSNSFIIDKIENKKIDVPVYGSRIGTAIYGTDWPDELLMNGAMDDIKILSPLETLKQGIENRLTTKRGDYPLEDDFGISLVGSEYPKELRDGLLSIEVGQQIEMDKRIESIENIVISSEGNSVTLEATLKAINGEEKISVTL